MREEQTVARAIHGLHTELLALHVEHKHVSLVVLRVARLLPELEVEHVGRDDFLVAALPVLLLDHFHQAVIDTSAVRQPEARARRQLMEEEELLRRAQHSVIALLGLLLEQLPLLQLLGVGERHAIHPLKGVVLDLPKPVGAGSLGSGEGLDLARVGDVRAHAQVDERAALVDGGEAALGDLVLDKVHLERVLREHLQRLFLA